MKGIDEILIPAEYTYYTDDEFAKRLQKLDEMYNNIFPPETVKKLKHADSLYVWGNILTLESSKLMEQASTNNNDIVISSVFKKKDTNNETESRTTTMINKAIELKNTALKLYHTALDIKFNIFKEKIKSVIISQPTVDYTFMEERLAEANAYYRKAVDDMNEAITYNAENYEKEGSMKREAVNLQEEALLLYMEYLNGNTSVQDSLLNTNIQEEPEKPQEDTEKNSAAENKNASTEKTSSAGSDKKVEYKIQVGVFKNAPAEDVLKKIPAVSKSPIPEKGLTKYYAGSYTTYEEAQKELKTVKDAGFSGAFIVAFFNGERISISKAKELAH
jgi:hypothetical protein